MQEIDRASAATERKRKRERMEIEKKMPIYNNPKLYNGSMRNH
jgi:hypothetical protein